MHQQIDFKYTTGVITFILYNHRWIQGDSWGGGESPLLTPFLKELRYRLVKTCFNRIFQISSLTFLFLPCFVILVLNYTSVSFDFSSNKMFSIKNGAPLWKCLDPPHITYLNKEWESDGLCNKTCITLVMVSIEATVNLLSFSMCSNLDTSPISLIKWKLFVWSL